MSENVGFFANKLVVSLPGCETPVSVDWGINLASQFWPFAVSIEYASQEGCGQDPDLLRNYTVGYAIGTKTKYILFLSPNCLPPNWAVHRLLEGLRMDPKMMICAAMSRTNVPEYVEYLDEVSLFVDENKNEFEVLTIAPNNYVELECTLVRTEVFDAIGEPWFKSTELVSSASYLCHKVQEAGYKICAHTGVICGHVDESGKSIWPSEAIIPQHV